MKDQPSKLLQHLLPTFANLVWMLAFFIVLISGPRLMNADGDLGRHLTIGRYMLEHAEIPLRDLFSHTMAGHPLTPHEWLSQVIFALADKLMGLNGVILVCAVIIATTFRFVFVQARMASRTLGAALLVVMLAMLASAMHWLSRPHIFTFLLLAVWMTVLYQLRKGKVKQWWLLPALMLIWANLHGAFIAGFATWITYGVGLFWDSLHHNIPEDEALHPRFWRYYLLGGGAAFLVSLINPSGLGLWKTSLGYIGNDYLVNHTVEYMSPNFHNANFWPFLIFIALLLVAIGLSKKRIESGLLFTSAAWLVMGLYSGRNIPLFAIVAAPLLAQGLDELISGVTSRVKFLGRLNDLDVRIQKLDVTLKGYFWPVISVVSAVICFSAGFRFDAGKTGNVFYPQSFPVEAVNWLQENPQKGDMFNSFTWGGYLLYRLWPEKQVFIDGQTDFYGEALSREYAQVMNAAEGWQSILEDYQVEWAILPSKDGIVQALSSDLGWESVYSDDTAVILRRK
jgi:hypothetical protein